MTKEEAKEVFLNRGFVNGLFDGDKWRESVVVISKWLEQEPCEDAISRQAAIDALMELLDRPNHAEFLYTDEICRVLNHLSPVEPQPKYEDIAKAFQFGMALGFGKKHDEMDKVIKEVKKAISSEQEPCEDAVNRQAVLEYIEGSEAELGHSSENELVCQDIKELPTVTPQPKTGHWIDRFPAKECKCSVCDFLICISNGSYIDMVGQMKYCPNCGAKMVEP